ncbi:MAG: SirB1 family protein [Acidimicrobiales bacterium]
MTASDRPEPPEAPGEATASFWALVAPDGPATLDEGALLIAAHAYPELDVARELGQLDQLAEKSTGATLDALCQLLFDDLGFTGNTAAYYDPRNSFLNDVIERRTGIPITLAVVMIEVGRRIGVGLDGVGMPGHFLVRTRAEPVEFVDVFAGGRRMDAAGAQQVFAALAPPGAPWDPAYLNPVDSRAILARILGNLKGRYRSDKDRRGLEWVLRLRSRIPGVPLSERQELAAVLAALGRFDRAAAELELLAELSPEAKGDHQAAAARLRANLN